ncbi:asparaginase [Pollutimonas sp. M17]|uniref:asparaginase n=1 Tax=Pollutimonas sp. M17 TaxID=2962065 RepID=UPI0021F45744|nr:asparaginase [Pollutimonas sp. M17]UYO92515.1 asparaginase [Pollutimonas sp. M17]
MSKPKLIVVSTGGTITMTSGQGAKGIAPTLTAADLLNAVPQIAQQADIEALTFSSMPGASLTTNHIVDLAKLIQQRFDAGIDGAIVIQGTDTIEETSFLLDLLVADSKPLIVTGAMRGAQAAGADGPANLLASVVVAGSPHAAGRGSLVVLNDEIHAAAFVRKGHTGLTSSFISPNCGPIGLVCEQRALFTSSPAAPRRSTPAPGALADIAIVKACLGDDGRILDALPGMAYAGVVVEAMGAGHVPQSWVPGLSGLAEKMPVVLAVRTPAGPVFNNTYGFPGSEIDLINRGLIPAGLLDALKARLLLGVSMGNNETPEGIRLQFKRFSYLQD